MIESILWIVFVLACIVVSAVILLQEGKGGGLGEAFGGVGQQTFGVKAEGINKFTGYVALVVVVLAITITKMRSDGSSLAFGEGLPPINVPGSEESLTPIDPGAAGAGDAVPGDSAPGDSAPGDAAPPAGDSAPAPTGDGAPKGDGK